MYTCKRMRFNPYLTPYMKISSKWIEDLNVRAKIIKCLEENACNFGLGNGILDMTPKAQVSKEKKTDQLDFVKIKNFNAASFLIKNFNEKESEDNPQKKRKSLQLIYLVSGLVSDYKKSFYNSTIENILNGPSVSISLSLSLSSSSLSPSHIFYVPSIFVSVSLCLSVFFSPSFSLCLLLSSFLLSPPHTSVLCSRPGLARATINGNVLPADVYPALGGS